MVFLLAGLNNIVLLCAGALPPCGLPLAVPCDADLSVRLNLVHGVRVRGALPLCGPFQERVGHTVQFVFLDRLNIAQMVSLSLYKRVHTT